MLEKRKIVAVYGKRKNEEERRIKEGRRKENHLEQEGKWHTAFVQSMLRPIGSN